MKEYSKKEQYKILAQSAILVNDEGSYRIEYVPEYDELSNESIILVDEEDGMDYYFAFEDIDLNDPTVSTYKLVLSNPMME